MPNKLPLLLLAGLLAGTLIPLVPVFNQTLNKYSGGLFQSIPIVFTVGLLASSLLRLLFVRESLLSMQLSQAPWYAFMSGIIMMTYLVTATFLAPRLSVGLTISLIVSGQLIMAVMIDHFGLFGAVRVALSPARILGILMLLGGIVLLRR